MPHTNLINESSFEKVSTGAGVSIFGAGVSPSLDLVGFILLSSLNVGVNVGIDVGSSALDDVGVVGAAVGPLVLGPLVGATV